MAAREYYIDRLRTVMTVLVILLHTSITYGASGGWFWRERDPSADLSSILLTAFAATNQSFFMGFFFLLAGYFTPRSLERKGYPAFLRDRFLRLGLPLLFFILILGPITVALANWGDGNSFWLTLQHLWQRQRIINGPLWFAEALLIFTLAYCAWRKVFGSPLTQSSRPPKPIPSQLWWLISALAVGAVALAIRQFVPTGQNIFGMQLGYFSSYIFLFSLGVATWRYDWLNQLEWKQIRPWAITLIVAWPTLPYALYLVSTHRVPSMSFGGGHSWVAILYAFWEPFVAWGIIGLFLLNFRNRMNQPSPIWDWLNRRAYAVYILHPPILVGLALLFHHWIAPDLVKFAVTGTLACAATWLAADPFVRLPGIRSIV